MNPQFKINGIERRDLKKELSKLKSLCKNFWYYHQLDKDMCSFYGGSGDFPMSDEEAMEKLQLAFIKIKKIEEHLAVLYCT
jgi:hypothetical protein